jgi:rfaE bifunctional protein kinase chain/domain
VLEFTRQFDVPGGAANPAQNICALGGEASIVGLIGRDETGTQLLSLLHQAHINSDGVVVDGGRPTTTKTRILAEGSLRFPQQVARVDYLDRQEVGGESQSELISRVKELIPTVDAVLVSDYQTGVAAQVLVRAAERSAHAHGKVCTVDAQGSFRKYEGFDLIKGNRQEIEAFLSCQLDEEEGYQRAGEQLLSELSASAVIITRGSEGLSLISHSEGYHHLPAANRSTVYDVTGAGDTVIGLATLGLIAGASFVDAARLANLAAGLVVRKLGNAVATADELAWAVENWQARQ